MKCSGVVFILRIVGTHLTGEGIAHVIDRLRNNTTVTAVALTYGNIGATDGVALAEVLLGDVVVTAVDLSSNHLHDSGCVVLAAALSVNQSVTTLHMHGNGIGAPGATKLALALEANHTVTHLNLSSNHIGDTGAQRLAEALRTNVTLCKLNLAANGIGAVGTRALAASLYRQGISPGAVAGAQCPGSEGIQVLDLSWNEADAAALGNLLAHDTPLTTLRVAYNKLGTTGACHVAAGLRSNTTLQVLDLASNNIGADGGVALGEALVVPTTALALAALDLTGNTALAALHHGLVQAWQPRPPEGLRVL